MANSFLTRQDLSMDAAFMFCICNFCNSGSWKILDNCTIEGKIVTLTVSDSFMNFL